MIEVKNLVKRYGDYLAVDHLSFHVDKGQIYGFLGPNGAGKSTTMNIMTGYLASTEGEVLINGMNILEEPEKVKKCIGYLPEQPPLYFDMTVEEYLKFAADLKKIEKEKRKDQIEQVMEMTGITAVRERLIRNLSKGYKQRVGLAQAILGYPEILILDEPTVGLDPKQIIEIRELIRSLSKNHTIILSSHILSEISAVCDYVMIINHGKLVASDTTENLEKMAIGSNTLDMTVKGKRNDVEKILESVEEIQSLEWDTKDRKKYESSEENTVSFSIKTDENIDIREKLFYKLAEAKLPILKMQATRISLEDVFLELTQNEKEETAHDSDI
ncbi:MAG: ABC transporter ATP-binding protein [Oliverpabstia sp.]